MFEGEYSTYLILGIIMRLEIEAFLRRAEGFVRDALEDLKRGDYDLAMYHIEQACQLVVKARLLI